MSDTQKENVLIVRVQTLSVSADTVILKYSAALVNRYNSSLYEISAIWEYRKSEVLLII